MSLIGKFYSDRFFHIKQLAPSVCVSGALCLAAAQLHSPEFYTYYFDWWLLALIPIGFWVGGLSVVFIHNATHNSFSPRWMNRIVGHISGMHQLWGFNGWKLIHAFHHLYTDKADQDPHSPIGMTFAEYCKKMFFYPSQLISKRYYEHYGSNLKSHITRKFSFILFLALVSLNITFWYLLLGPTYMIFFYLPSYIGSYWLFAHLNYYGHYVDPSTGETHPVNLDDGWYFWTANRCWFGIYFHANHHKKPLVFNPRYIPQKTIQAAVYQ
ncbi:MAG: fatty acid desaturase [Rickettsiales bacterium]|jgi:fatty acid desaturase|nr:fatty acid desaturase [Rickettsiales bacterium]